MIEGLSNVLGGLMSLRWKILKILVISLALFGSGAARAQSDLSYDTNSTFLKWPDHIYMGEPAGVAHNSKGHIFVYTRTGSVNASTGTSRTFVRGGARLFEFDQNGNYVREIGQDLYGFVFAENVRVDSQDNIWVVDSGSNMVIKFDPQGRVAMTFGRKPESITVPDVPPESMPASSPTAFGGRGPGAGILGDNFNRPADVAWDSAGNIFVADGHGPGTNARVAKFDKDGRFVKTWGFRGKGEGQFDNPHAIVADAKGNVYVADHGNKRIQVFDNDGNFKTQYTNVGAPFAMCITHGPHQYIYSSNSNYSGDLQGGEIYKLELDGTVAGKFGLAGKGPKQFGAVHALDCQSENVIYAGEVVNWRIQRVTLHPGKSSE
jgi:DNA-binding beta-propeller fold protein YncE